MENGSSPRPGGDAGAGRNGAASDGGLPLTARLIGVGARGAGAVSRATGFDRAVEIAAEEAIVRAVESGAVERAMARVLDGPAVEEAVQGALRSDAVKRALLEAIDSELVDEVWRRLLASEEAQQLIERIAGAPEVRAAISAQGVGLVEDIGRTVGRLARRLDDSFERLARRLFFRRQRQLPSDRAGAVSRGLATLLDGVLVNLCFTGAAAIVAFAQSQLELGGGRVSGLTIAVGSSLWLAFGAAYLLAFWTLAGQTPGMRFLGIRLGERLGLGRGVKRLLGLWLSVICFGVGFLGIVFGAQRRAWDDRLCGCDVLYDERRPEPAPWSRRADLAASAR